MITLEYLTNENYDAVRALHREDIPLEWVDGPETLMELTEYGLTHACIGHTYAVRYGSDYIGLILLGEAIPWETDPPEMRGVPFYRLMGFVIDKHYRGRGIGGRVLEMVIDRIYREYGVRPIALGVHKDNHRAARFYQTHGFRKTDVMEGNDYYFLRYPERLLETADLLLRPGSHDDWQDLHRNLWSREDIFRYMFSKHSPSEEAAKKRTFSYVEMHKEIKTEFFVIEKASGQAIGIAGVKELRPGFWTITDIAIGPDFHGRGYGRQIVKALLELAFGHGGKEVAYDCFCENLASKKLALSCGFTFSHTEEAELTKNGEKVLLDYYVYKGNRITMEIIPYTKERIPDVLQFEHDLRKEEDFWSWAIDDQYIADVTKSFDDPAFANSLSLLAYVDGKVVGRIDSTKICSHFDGSTKAYLDWICVIKSYRHKGVAQALMNSLRQELKEQGVDTLIGLIAANPDAQRFYRNLPDAQIRDEGIWIDL